MAVPNTPLVINVTAWKVSVFGFILVLFRIWTEYGEKLRIFPYSVRMRENADQNSSKYGLFLHSDVQGT